MAKKEEPTRDAEEEKDVLVVKRIGGGSNGLCPWRRLPPRALNNSRIACSLRDLEVDIKDAAARMLSFHGMTEDEMSLHQEEYAGAEASSVFFMDGPRQTGGTPGGRVMLSNPGGRVMLSKMSCAKRVSGSSGQT